MLGVTARKRRERLHRPPCHRLHSGLLHKGHILLVKPGAFGERVIANDVLLDETADSCADSGLHDPKLWTSAACR